MSSSVPAVVLRIDHRWDTTPAIGILGCRTAIQIIKPFKLHCTVSTAISVTTVLPLLPSSFSFRLSIVAYRPK